VRSGSNSSKAYGPSEEEVWPDPTRTKARTFSGAIKRSGSKDPIEVSNLFRSEMTRICRQQTAQGR
jgi:hypothetical protein